MHASSSKSLVQGDCSASLRSDARTTSGGGFETQMIVPKACFSDALATHLGR